MSGNGETFMDATTPVDGPAAVDATMPPWLQRKLAAEFDEDAWNEDVLRRLAPRRGRVIVLRPRVARLSVDAQTAGGMHIPDIAIRNLREFGLVTTVMKLHADNVEELRVEGVILGARVLIPEYAGNPLWLGRETRYWIVAVSDIFAVVEGGIHEEGARV